MGVVGVAEQTKRVTGLINDNSITQKECSGSETTEGGATIRACACGSSDDVTTTTGPDSLWVETR